jgi:2-phosphoglycerate kinase
MLPSDKFNTAWANHEVSKPLIILLGGYAGTGKSTLAARFTNQISHAQIIPTGIFRSIAQTQTNSNRDPALFVPTYDLHTLQGQEQNSIVGAYQKQCAPVTTIIRSVISFLATEKQHLIIEGNHILPQERYAHSGCYIIELYMYVGDGDQHRKMLGGPTHNRTIANEQFATGRVIHDNLCMEARKHKKVLFECSDMDKAEAYLQQQISKIMRAETKTQGIRTQDAYVKL